MALKYVKLKGRIIEKYGNQSNFAKALNTFNTTVSRKLCDNVAFTAKDIEQWSELLDISQEEIGLFFYPKS